MRSCSVRGDVSALDHFSPLEVYEVLMRIEGADEETVASLVAHLRICEEVGFSFLHPGAGSDSVEEDEAFVMQALPGVIGELEPEDV
jgi:hypothetical protein